MKKTIRTLIVLLLVGTVTLMQQGCFGSSNSEEGNSRPSSITNDTATSITNDTAPSITFSDCSTELNAKDDKNSSPDPNQTSPDSNNTGTGSGSKNWAKLKPGPCEIAEADNVIHYVIPKGGIISNGTIIKMDDFISGFCTTEDNYPDWFYESAGDGSYYICWEKNRNFVIEVQNGAASDGALLQLNQRNDSKGQRWFFESCHTHPEYKKDDHKGYIIHTALNTDYVIEMIDRDIVLKRYNGSITQKWIISK